MSEPDVLVYFKASYFISIIFGTMPVKLNFIPVCHRDTNIDRRETVDCVFVKITEAWMALLVAFVVSDLYTLAEFTPTLFFSQKLVDNLPNDYHCIRLLHDAEICSILACNLVCIKKLPGIVQDLRMYRSQQKYSAPSATSRIKSKISALILFYSTITVLPICVDLYHLYQQTNVLELARILQQMLHCIPLTINLQFCCMCILLAGELDALNEKIQESSRLFPEIGVRKLGQSHSTICQLVYRLNRVYEIQLLLETAIITLNILLHTFHVLNANDHKLQSHLADIIYSSLWTLHFAARLCTASMIASNTIMQAKETRKALLQLEDCNQISRYHEQIISLLNQITNQDINFNICGFFMLDGDLIISILSWCISLILILLQFRTPT